MWARASWPPSWEACWAWRRLPVPVIAAVEGHCYGGGLQLALAADFRVASPDSQWSVLEGRWGIIPDMSGIVTLKQLVGSDTANLKGTWPEDVALAAELVASGRSPIAP